MLLTPHFLKRIGLNLDGLMKAVDSTVSTSKKCLQIL